MTLQLEMLISNEERIAAEKSTRAPEGLSVVGVEMDGHHAHQEQCPLISQAFT